MRREKIMRKKKRETHRHVRANADIRREKENTIENVRDLNVMEES